jgi:hypothetical protein
VEAAAEGEEEVAVVVAEEGVEEAAAEEAEEEEAEEGVEVEGATVAAWAPAEAMAAAE